MIGNAYRLVFMFIVPLALVVEALQGRWSGLHTFAAIVSFVAWAPILKGSERLDEV